MMNMRAMLGESGRTMSDNEPRFEMRTPEGQMFTIDSMINNLMQEYDMVVRNQEFNRAQAVANEIDKLQQQKIAIQAQRANAQIATSPMGSQMQQVPQQDQISRILDDIAI